MPLAVIEAKANKYEVSKGMQQGLDSAACWMCPLCLPAIVLATGKTYITFQIIWRLWKSKVKQRILFLADRNILVEQTRLSEAQTTQL